MWILRNTGREFLWGLQVEQFRQEIRHRGECIRPSIAVSNSFHRHITGRYTDRKQDLEGRLWNCATEARSSMYVIRSITTYRRSRAWSAVRWIWVYEGVNLFGLLGWLRSSGTGDGCLFEMRFQEPHEDRPYEWISVLQPCMAIPDWTRQRWQRSQNVRVCKN